MSEEAASEHGAGELTALSDDPDVILLNGAMFPRAEEALRKALASHEPGSKHLVLVLVTSGGLPDTAYRIAMLLRRRYEKLTVCIPGWCKSAGTLLAIAGDDLIIGDRGEMGPLDVQIAKRDELAGDRDSGLVINEALKRLRAESFDAFSEFLIRIVAESPTLVTFRTAADVAANLTIGLMSPIFEKIDPLRMGADARAMNIGEEYAVRLNAIGKNLKGADALNMLLNGFPSHSFVIGIEGARDLFTRVQALEGALAERVEALGDAALKPLPVEIARVEFLEEDEDEGDASESADGAAEPSDSDPATGDGVGAGGNGPADDVGGDHEAGAG